jgi:hypothetical protein
MAVPYYKQPDQMDCSPACTGTGAAKAAKFFN